MHLPWFAKHHTFLHFYIPLSWWWFCFHNGPFLAYHSCLLFTLRIWLLWEIDLSLGTSVSHCCTIKGLHRTPLNRTAICALGWLLTIMWRQNLYLASINDDHGRRPGPIGPGQISQLTFAASTSLWYAPSAILVPLILILALYFLCQRMPLVNQICLL